MEQEEISAFAYKAAKGIEAFINVSNNNLNGQNQLLEAKILDFYQKLISEDREYYGTSEDIARLYRIHFGITTDTQGVIE